MMNFKSCRESIKCESAEVSAQNALSSANAHSLEARERKFLRFGSEISIVEVQIVESEKGQSDTGSFYRV